MVNLNLESKKDDVELRKDSKEQIHYMLLNSENGVWSYPADLKSENQKRVLRRIVKDCRLDKTKQIVYRRFTVKNKELEFEWIATKDSLCRLKTEFGK